MTTSEARSRLGLSKDVFLTRYQTRGIRPAYVHISTGAYYWDLVAMAAISVSDAEFKSLTARKN